jgi:hypothetical protein
MAACNNIFFISLISGSENIGGVIMAVESLSGGGINIFNNGEKKASNESVWRQQLA